MQLIRRFNIFKAHPRYYFHQLNDTTALSEDTVMIQEAALQFAKEKLQPYAGDWDKNHHFPVDILKESAQQGFAAIYTSPEYGGCGLDRVTASVIFEALAYGCVASSAYLSIHNMCCWAVDTFGNEAQKNNWLTNMTTLDMFASYCLTEPNSGSDSRAMKTHAKQDGDDYIINGSKCFISGGSNSDIYLVFCRTGEKNISLFGIEKGTKGLSYGKLEDKMGWRSQPTTMVLMENVRVKKDNLIGKEGDGFKIAMMALDGGRVNIGSCSLGGAAYGIELAQNYMHERKQFGKELADFQHLQFKLADMATTLTSSRLMIRNAARLIDEDSKDKSLYCSMAKRYATDNCFNVVNDALQIYGGYGYLSEYPLERQWKMIRDLRVHSILEGTNEIMRLIISRQLLKQ